MNFVHIDSCVTFYVTAEKALKTHIKNFKMQ